MLSQASVPHFYKLSSGFKHLERNLHVGSIWALNGKKWIRICVIEENQKTSIITSSSFFVY